MSAYKEYQTQFKDLDCLLHALQTVPGRDGRIFTREQIEVHEQAVPLVGFHGDTREQKAHIIIRRKHVGAAANDIGYERLADGTYVARISEFDGRNGYDASYTQKLAMAYSQEVVTRKARRLGYRMATTRQKDGSIRMVLTR